MHSLRWLFLLVLSAATASADAAPSGISYNVFLKSPDTLQHSRDTVAPRQILDTQAVAGAARPARASTDLLQLANTSDWLGPVDMLVMDSFLYLAFNFGLLVYDVHNPAAPVFVSRYYFPVPSVDGFATPRELKGENGFLYLLNPTDGIQIFDATNPANLVPRGHLALAVLYNYLEVHNNILYLPSVYGYLFTVDVSDPDNPTLLKQWSSEQVLLWDLAGMAADFSSDAPLLYFSSMTDNTPFYTLRVWDGVAVEVLDIYWGALESLPPYGGLLARAGHYLLANGIRPSPPNIIHVMDVSDYLAQYACSLNVGANVFAFTAEDNRLYVSSGSTLITYDITTPCQAVQLAAIDLDGQMFQYWQVGQIYAWDHSLVNFGGDEYRRQRAAIANVTNPAAAVAQPFYMAKDVQQIELCPTGPAGIGWSAEVLYAARVYDLTKPTLPVAGTDIGPGSGVQTGAQLVGTKFYACAVSPASVTCMDITDPQAASFVWVKGLGNRNVQFRDLAVSGRYFFVAAEDSGLYVFEERSPVNSGIFEIGHLALPKQARSIVVRGNRAFVACWGEDLGGGTYAGAELQVVDISDPTQPQLLGTQGPWGHYNVELAGDRLATTSWLGEQWGVAVYDIDAAGWPQLVTSVAPLEQSGWLQLFALGGNYLYVRNDRELDIVDISDPLNPLLADYYRPLGFYLFDAAVKGETVYIGEQFGMTIFRGPSCCAGTTGNVDDVGIVDLPDLSRLIGYLIGTGSLICYGEADINQSGVIDLADLSTLVAYLTVPAPNKPVLPGCE